MNELPFSPEMWADALELVSAWDASQGMFLVRGLFPRVGWIHARLGVNPESTWWR